jgi:hypothetical protein
MSIVFSPQSISERVSCRYRLSPLRSGDFADLDDIPGDDEFASAMRRLTSPLRLGRAYVCQLFPNYGAAYLMSHEMAKAVAVIIVEIKNESPISLNHSQ